MNIDIATAQSRRQTTWHNETWSWDQFVKKIQSTHRTAESYATYMSAAKDRQAEIKDVGGFVGGYLVNGHRGKGSVKYRQLLTLDVDFAYPGFWDDFTIFYNCCAAVYSTHKHSVIAPRLRLLIPLDRQVSVEEYEAIGRKIASVMDMKCFDGTGFQPYRMMFFPSTAKDGDYYFREQQGDWLSADSVLAQYHNWKDVSEWPLCPTESEIVRSDMKKQEDPTEKEGVIGAFCRVYSISEVIAEFLPDVYTPCDYGDRYTYCGGTTAAGAVCYEDKWLFSHHSTDPASGVLCNAFDLVRIHKFGAQDTADKKVSLGLMMNLASTDAAVVRELGIFNLPEEVTAAGTEWLEKLEVDKKGNYLTTIDNFLVVLRNDPRLKDKYWYNEFDYRVHAQGKDGLIELSDKDESDLLHYFEKTYTMYHEAKSSHAARIGATDRPYHPVRDYLNGLEWDGKERLDTLFIEHLGAADTPYTRAVTRKSLCGAVARVMTPGCKYDYMPVAIGPQGHGKSSLLYDLGGAWFSDTLDSVTGKEAYMQTQGVWIMEMAELSGMKKAEIEAAKHFITKREDRYRVPFAKNTTLFKRQCVFFGSTNENTPLKDPTGGRRFWPFMVTKKYKPGSIKADPIWAEAVYRWKQGEELYLSEELEAMAQERQMAHTEIDERSEAIRQFLEMRLPEDWAEKQTWERKSYIGAYDEKEAKAKGHSRRNRICAAEVWCELFDQKLSEMSSYNTKYIHQALASMPGWGRSEELHNYPRYGNQRSYVRVGHQNGYSQEENQVIKDILDINRNRV